jgi:cyanate lyase
VRLGNSIKIEPAGKKISGKINLSEELIDELQEYSKKKAVMPATPHCPLTEKNVKEEKPVKK